MVTGPPHPQRKRSVRPGMCLDPDRLTASQRRHPPISERRRTGPQHPCCQVQHPRRLHRSMHHQIVIAFDPGRVGAVIMDAVSVEGQRRIAKQQHRVGRDAKVGQRRPQIGSDGIVRQWRPRHRVGAVHQILPFRHTHASRDTVIVPDRHKAQTTGRSGLEGDRLDRAVALHKVAFGKATAGHNLTPRPHPARQWQARQDQARLRVAVAAQIRRRQGIWRQGPEQAQRHLNLGQTAEKRGAKLCDQPRRTFDLMLLLARTTPLMDGMKKTDGLSVILVDMRQAMGNGLTIRPIRTMMNHATTEVFFDNLRVPAKNLIGEEGKGFRYILIGMNAERLLIAAECVGDSKWFIDRATAYARDRVVFGRPIGQNQGVQFPITKA